MFGKVASLEQGIATASTPVDKTVDIDLIRDRTLAKLKVGKQSVAGKAIDAFIRELKHN